jgi:hypothetical protein
MILEGNFIKFGTVLDERKVPPHLRKRKYILRSGEIDQDEINLNAQMQAVEQEVELEPNIEEAAATEEDSIRTRIANRRATRR